MPKRFTATEKWADPWFTGLKPHEKLFWLYLLDNCDHAGVWVVNWNYIDHMGERPDLSKFEDRIFQIADEKVFIPKFLVFQYGANWHIGSKIKARESAIKILKNLGMLEKAIELTKIKSIHTVSNPIKGLRTLSSPIHTITDTALATATDLDTATAPNKRGVAAEKNPVVWS